MLTFKNMTSYVTSTSVNQKIVKNLLGLFLASTFILSGCAVTSENEVPTVKLKKPFDINSVSYIKEEGDSSIIGQAFLKQQGGGVVTCAGNTVRLIPYSEYAEERLSHIYNNIINDDNTYLAVYALNFDPEYPEYSQYTKITTCDASGNFHFKNISSGEYFIQSSVYWSVGNAPQGGALIKRLKLGLNEKTSIIITK